MRGLAGSSASLVGSVLAGKINSPLIFILNDKEEAAYFYDDLNNLNTDRQVLFFPSSYRRSVQYNHLEQENIILRTDVLNQLRDERRLSIVTYPEALIEQVVSQESLTSNSLKVTKGDKLSIDFLDEVLYEYDFERVDFVTEPGQFAVRGSLVDIFSFAGEDPYRIDFFGDEIDSIRSFDIETQNSREQLHKIVIIPDIQNGLKNEKRESFLSYIPDDSILWIKDPQLFIDQLNLLYEQTISHRNEESPESLHIIPPAEFEMTIANFRCVDAGHQSFFKNAETVEFQTSPQPVFRKNFDLIAEDLQRHSQQDYHNFILFSSEKQTERLTAIFKDQGKKAEFTALPFVLHEGFIDHKLKLCCYTDHQIFERYHRFQIKSRKNSKENISIKELNKLHPGDYVVHSDHGIGKFAGLVKTAINGKTQEAIRLIYKDNDVLFVSIHSLHRISKYKGKDGVEPKVNKLGNGAWQKLKDRTKSKVKDIARELIALYAKRRQEKGYAFSPDSYLQNELEASFMFEDTPDQTKTTQAIKEDMEKEMPMDRLICGDVGFGKTELAIRAAFKAVTDSKQVAVLVPTTILALQHFRTFTERLKDFPVHIEYISRLRPSVEIHKILKEVEAGQVDILIGTHRLVGRDVHFKDLGLLIVDEEQKFGVSVKEKLKRLKVNVDTLTLTATPIPRTLQFSLMGARDLSIIQTPPPNRYPIITELYGFNEDIIREAINYEVARNGQVFFIHNRVQNILEVEATIKRLVPEVRTIVGHGQLEGPKLEKIMLDFINGEYDVLIATTIIESGLDIPNANTIFINHAEHFGLSDLHQLRGRVGRSNKKSFCYLLAPPLATVTPEARRRLKAIEEFSDLGSGFDIAMRDLDIRGAGNLLGAEQSGFIADIGFETYHRILSEAMQELRQDEFKNLFDEENKLKENRAFRQNRFIEDCQIDTDMELLFPDEYIQSVSERMLLYRQMDAIDNDKKLCEFERSLEDRFGKIPAQSRELLEVVRLRWIAIGLGIERIILKNKTMICYFISDQQSTYYQSPAFTEILQYVQQHPASCKMKEKANKLTLRFDKVSAIMQARQILAEVHPKEIIPQETEAGNP